MNCEGTARGRPLRTGDARRLWHDEAEYSQSVQSGITKLNFASYLQIGMAQAMREALGKPDTQHMFAMEANKAQINAGVEIIKKHIRMFETQPVD